MKNIEHIKEIAAYDGNDIIYTAEGDVFVRDVIIDVGSGQEVMIGCISDIHINCHEHSYPKLPSVNNLRRCLSLIHDADQIVINGDTLDYLSKETMEAMAKEVWDKIPNAIANIGGHERTVREYSDIPQSTTPEERLSLLQKFWRHDIYYYSRLIKNKVMAVCLCNDRAIISENTFKKLKADVALCREKGYIMLLFAHEPIATKNPAYSCYTEDMALTVGKYSSLPFDLCDGVVKNGARLLGNEGCDSVSLAAYQLIVNSADVIKGFFAGHLHHDMHLEIAAKTSSGKSAVIPQYVTTTATYDGGHLMRILIK